MLNLEKYARDGFLNESEVIRRDRLMDLIGALRCALIANDKGLNDLSTADLILEREKHDHEIVYRSSIIVGSSFAAYNLIGQSRMLEIASQITGANPFDLHCMPLHITIQPPKDDSFDYSSHQEGLFYPWHPEILTFWFPILSASTVNGGTMSVLPGSHSNGERPSDRYKKPNGFVQIETILTEKEKNQFIPIEIELGAVTVFGGHLVHSSLPNCSETPRVTGILRIVNMAALDKPKPLYKALSHGD
jgi:ectoine hydroxylase-related dioxygenase (phytanoyl-CoA dioxygenase family)